MAAVAEKERFSVGIRKNGGNFGLSVVVAKCHLPTSLTFMLTFAL